MEPTGLSSKIFICLGSKASLISCLSGFSGLAAYGVILGVLFLCGFGIPIPEDIILIAAGILAALGKISLIGAMLAGLFGVLVGDTFCFCLGRYMGQDVFKLPLLKKLMPAHRVKKAEKKIQENSKFICFIARFLPGLRSPIFITSGVMGVKPLIFIALDGAAALISVPLWVYVGWWIGEEWDQNLKLVKRMHIYLFIAIAIIFVGYFIIRRYQRKF